jgi:hypothetical protein
MVVDSLPPLLLLNRYSLVTLLLEPGPSSLELLYHRPCLGLPSPPLLLPHLLPPVCLSGPHPSRRRSALVSLMFRTIPSLFLGLSGVSRRVDRLIHWGDARFGAMTGSLWPFVAASFGFEVLVICFLPPGLVQALRPFFPAAHFTSSGRRRSSHGAVGWCFGSQASLPPLGSAYWTVSRVKHVFHVTDPVFLRAPSTGWTLVTRRFDHLVLGGTTTASATLGILLPTGDCNPLPHTFSDLQLPWMPFDTVLDAMTPARSLAFPPHVPTDLQREVRWQSAQPPVVQPWGLFPITFPPSW